ncbi:DUF1385 domain-containing protein [Candidatus Woesearchaeota archaeon]|nr:DUF1385 domain-containing protein [Candidatus Woesearchaeota archaeon]
MEEQPVFYGGQAVIEGVMMRGKKVAVTAVRKKGKILFRIDKIKKRGAWTRWFLVRGIANLVDMLVLGTKTLNWSAETAAGEGDDGGRSGEKSSPEKTKGKNQKSSGLSAGKLSSGMLAGIMLLSFLFAMGLFVLLPYALTYLLGIAEQEKPLLFNIVDGIIKIGIFVLYVWLISFMKDIYRVFQYHGAEHKSIHCLESGKELKAANAKKFSTLHPRCGTSFILFVMVVAVFLFSFIPQLAQWMFPGINAVHWLLRRGILFTLRILLLPVVAGISYEVLRFSAKHQGNAVCKGLSKPGMWIQKLTTKEPSIKQQEVGILALKKVLELEKAR